MFDAYEAVDALIDDINAEYLESVDEHASEYEDIYNELCERVDNGELTLEEAEVINEMAAEKYLGEESPESDPMFEDAVDLCLESLADTDPELFELTESVGSHPYEGLMSQKAYQKLVSKAIQDENFELPEKYTDDKKFVRAFKRDVAKARKAANTAQKSGVKKSVAAAAAAAAVIGVTAGAVALDRYNDREYSDKIKAHVLNTADNFNGKKRNPDYTKRTGADVRSCRAAKQTHNQRKADIKAAFKNDEYKKKYIQTGKSKYLKKIK